MLRTLTALSLIAGLASVSSPLGAQTAPTQQPPTETKPTENRPTENRPTENRPTENRPTENRPTDTKPATRAPAKTTAKPAGKVPNQKSPAKPGAATTPSQKLATDSLAALLRGDDAKPIETALDAELTRLAEAGDPVADIESFYAIARAGRVAGLLAQTKSKTDREHLIAALQKAPRFADELIMALSDRDDPEKVAALAVKLWRVEGKRLDEFATLGAAVCLVHDREVFEQANENKVVADDPLKIFAYFANNAARMPLGLQNVPVQLLVLVVDATAKVPELQWAADRYRGDREIWKRFFEIQYDTAHFLSGAQKRVTTEGLTLPNILQYGGVCIDQAYFAANVGKASGIPAVIMSGSSAEVAHAWVAYLVWNGQNAVFETRAGRYPEYRAIVGRIQDPQTGGEVVEAELALRARLALTPADDRRRATALEDAGYLLARKLMPEDEAMATDAQGRPLHEKLTPEMVTRLLALSEAAANLSPGSARAWRLGVAVGVNGSWTVDQRNRWGEAIYKTLGYQYAAFGTDCLIRVISSAPDLVEQNKMWNWLFNLTKGNGDLASIVRFNQAAMFERDHNPEKAWECYEWILRLYADTSPMAVGAARKILLLLKENGKSIGEGATILGQAWARTTPPSSMNPDFAAQSNWFRLGRLYATALKDAGKQAEYVQVCAKLGIKPSSK